MGTMLFSNLQKTLYVVAAAYALERGRVCLSLEPINACSEDFNFFMLNEDHDEFTCL